MAHPIPIRSAHPSPGGIRRWVTTATAAAVMAGSFGSIAPASADEPADAVNAKPVVVPSLHEWTGGTGDLVLSNESRIVVDAGLEQIGEEFAGDLSEMTGLDLAVVSGESAAGDITLDLAPEDQHAAGGERYAEEGYRLITDTDVTISAPTETGVYYGTRSLLQILMQSEGRNDVPVGTAVDWPDYEERGFMLDVGRRFFTPEFIRDYIEMMSYYKLNRFQIHLNDNEIHPENNDFTKAYTGFRLKTDNAEFAGLASTDGAYDRADWDSFEDTAATRGVLLVPEIDVPAHSAAIVNWKREIGLNGGNSDMLDLSKPETIETVKDIFNEFAPWFRGSDLHFGADEYTREHSDVYRDFYNTMAEHIRGLGKQPVAWGSATVMSGGLEGYDKDVIINSWNNGWYGLDTAEADGVEFINTNDATLYVVPFANYYHGNGLNNQSLYQNWTPNEAGNQTVGASSVLGAQFAVWNDLVHEEYTEMDVHGLVEKSFPTIAQKTWAAVDPERTYAQFTSTIQTIGMGPGLTLIDEKSVPAVPGEISNGADVSATASAEGYPVSNLTDGQSLTRWESGTPDASDVTIDLGEAKQVGGVHADWAQNAPTGYGVETSVDGVFWNRVVQHEVDGAGADQVTFDTREARYIRLTGLTPANPEGAGVGAWSLSLLGPENLAVGSTATASGVEAASFPAALAVDGSEQTRWSANYDGQRWIATDLGSEQPLNQVTLKWEAASAKDYTVSVSDNGTDWTVVSAQTGKAAGARTDIVDFGTVSARHVRVDIQASTLGIYLSLYELEVRNTALTALNVTGSLEGTPNEDGQYGTPPVLTLAASGAAAADATIEYAVQAEGTDELNWVAYTEPVALEGNGTTTVHARATAGDETSEGYLEVNLETGSQEPGFIPEAPGKKDLNRDNEASFGAPRGPVAAGEDITLTTPTADTWYFVYADSTPVGWLLSDADAGITFQWPVDLKNGAKQISLTNANGELLGWDRVIKKSGPAKP
ncbi:hypothetical protein BJ994_003110 [Arthrobacter pigmenti]|uniref:F5/8 type C domain-containing protein n=1 Tax=Arthrobacter pigmenti TaxID=271432 RepID=A0A846RU19_9MICC|nr:discoidin domain-containing protein [Arthrobacter pigmenti]NJC24034.1 hypothetical protein [Arthrobacter pigmenti]